MSELNKRKLSAFAMARQTTFANVAWDAQDVLSLRPGWSEQRAAAFLKAVEVRIAAVALAAGTSALAALISECERNGD